MVDTVRDLKVGDYVHTQIYPMSQKYMYQLDIVKDTFGEESDEYKAAKEDYDEIWGERKGFIIQIGECFQDCILRTDTGKEIGMFHTMIGDMGHWCKESYGGKFCLSIKLEE